MSIVLRADVMGAAIAALDELPSLCGEIFPERFAIRYLRVKENHIPIVQIMCGFPHLEVLAGYVCILGEPIRTHFHYVDLCGEEETHDNGCEEREQNAAAADAETYKELRERGAHVSVGR